MTYYAQRKSINNGQPQPVVNKYGDRNEMEYQFHLFCASAVKTDIRELDSIEWGTLEQGVIERKKYTYTPVVEPTEPTEPEQSSIEPEPEPEYNYDYSSF